MASVFSRLFSESTTQKTERMRPKREKVIQEEEEKWKLKIAAECHLVDNTNKSEVQTVTVPSLSTSSLRKKRPSTMTHIPKMSRLAEAKTKPVSVVMSEDGSVTATTTYIVTDSVEPPPYTALRPTKSQNRFYCPILNEEEEVPKPQCGKIRAQLARTKSNPIKWGECTRESLNGAFPDPQSSKLTKRSQSSKSIMINMDEIVTLESIPNPIPMISTTGSCYDHYGYPTSTSSILEP